MRTLDTENMDSETRVTEDKYGESAFESCSVPKSPGKVLGDSRSAQSERYFEWGRKSQAENKVTSQDGVVIVSYFLPVILTRDAVGFWKAAWDSENVLTLQLESRTIWVGSVRYANAPIPPEEEEAVSIALADLNCFPVFLSQSLHCQFYDLFCKQHLWPIMHQIMDVYGPLDPAGIGAKAQQSVWLVYSTVHNMFRDRILEVYQQGYLVWIHGFHLMLLPSFVRRRIPGAKIGYYIHTPFPSSEIWRTMSRREDLLRGILGADQVGFHLFEYARHFLTVCRRLLGCSYEMNAAGMMVVNVDGREVVITCIHVGVDLPRLDEVFLKASFLQETAAWRDRSPGKVVVAGIDRLERLKGIPLRLMAIDAFLQENPRWVGRIAFNLLGISAAERGADYHQTQHDVRVLVAQLNAKYKDAQLVSFEERHDKDLRLAQRLAFFAASDILMITATRDGLNRYPMEFQLARKKVSELAGYAARSAPRLEGTGLPGQGLVIISEFISSARVMRGALAVNPWRLVEVTEALKHALEMGDQERSDRNRRNLEFCTRLTTVNWANHVLHDLKSVVKETAEYPGASYAVGFGLHYKVMNMRAGFQALDAKAVSSAYRAARSRLIILDWGGTLVSNSGTNDSMHTYAMAQGHAARESPTAEIKQVVEALCADPKNVVFVVSGKELSQVSEFFGGFKNLGLGAEHGFYYRWPRDDTRYATSDQHMSGAAGSGRAKWQTMAELGDQTWKESAKLVMDIFVQRTHGTYIERKGNALIWQFRDADPEFGYLQSKELEEHLVSVLAPHHVEVIRGGGVADGYIEVRPRGVSKGLFLEHALATMKANNNEADFVLAVGDDISDEPMFERLVRLQEQQQNPHFLQSHGGGHASAAMFGVTVGKKPTAANAYLDDPSAVVELLSSLGKASMREKKFFSALDLPSQALKDVAGFAQQAKQSQQQARQQVHFSPAPDRQQTSGTGSPYGSLVSG